MPSTRSNRSDSSHPVRLNYRRTFLIGFGFFGISVMWTLYNDYIPIFLQAGNPLFATSEAVTRTAGFGLGATWTGLIMTLDNLVALFFLPLIGIWSDRIWTPLGRRKPFIVALAPIAIITFIFIPLIVRGIAPELSGMTEALCRPLMLFIATLGLLITAMAGFRAPVVSLMPDLTPSPLRSHANGIINLMGGVGGVTIKLVGARLYNIDILLPFLMGGLLMAVAVLLLVFFVREPRHLSKTTAELQKSVEAVSTLQDVPTVRPQVRASLGFLLLSIFLWYVGYNALETFFTSYGVNVLQISENEAAVLGSIAYISFIIFALPGGYLAGRVGRKRAIRLGLVIFAVLLLIGYAVPRIPVIAGALGLGGFAWSLVNVNSLPMVLDTAETNAQIGTYTGFYFVATQASAIVGPLLNGYIIDRFEDYALTLLMPVLFFFVAAMTMQRVTRGEPRKS